MDATCLPSTDVALPSFRERFLVSDADAADPKGQYEPQTWPNAGTPERLRPSCVQRANDPLNPNQPPWSCSCPRAAAPTPALPTDGGIHPAFRVCFERVPIDPLAPLGPVQPGVVRVVSTGGTSFDVLNRPCEERGEGTAGDSAATVSVVVALSSALATPPGAALTVRGSLNESSSTTLRNLDLETNGLTASIGLYGLSNFAGLIPVTIPVRLATPRSSTTPCLRVSRPTSCSRRCFACAPTPTRTSRRRWC